MNSSVYEVTISVWPEILLDVLAWSTKSFGVADNENQQSGWWFSYTWGANHSDFSRKGLPASMVIASFTFQHRWQQLAFILRWGEYVHISDIAGTVGWFLLRVQLYHGADGYFEVLPWLRSNIPQSSDIELRTCVISNTDFNDHVQMNLAFKYDRDRTLFMLRWGHLPMFIPSPLAV